MSQISVQQDHWIYKYELKVTDIQNVMMPKGAIILTAQVQHGEPYLWAIVDPKAEPEGRNIEIFGTGHPIATDMGTSREYIGTIQLQGGSLVFHVFEYTGV